MAASGYILLTLQVEPEGDQFVSTCLELGTASCGDTAQEAFDNLKEAISVHLEALEEVGERERVFRQRGIEVLHPESVAPPYAPTAAEQDEIASQHILVPVEA